MSDSELAFDSDHDVSQSHSKLVEAVAQLDHRQNRVTDAKRTEPTLEVSEFHLIKSGVSDKDPVHVDELAKLLGKKGHHTELTKRLQSAKHKTKLLHKPLEKPAAERIKRTIAFDSNQKELRKWNAIITKNRTAESTEFPLVQTSMMLEPPKEFVKRFRIQSDLEKELAALEEPVEEANVEDKSKPNAMTLKEAILKRRETARIRAWQSYREAKAHRQKKIKSKKYHRLQKKDKIKKQLQEFENLQKTDPEAALKVLEQLDKVRAEERMLLRHKNTGQWARNKQIKAKYDKATRQQLAEQLSISRELTQKIRKGSDSEEESDAEADNTHITSSATDSGNPWVAPLKTDLEIEEFIQSYRKHWDKQSEAKEKTAAMNVSVENQKGFTNGDVCEIKSDANTVKETDASQTTAPISNGLVQEQKTKIKKPTHCDKLECKDEKPKNKGLPRVVATSAWNIDPIDIADNKERKRSSAPTKRKRESKLDTTFDIVEEKMKNHLNLKLKSVESELRVKKDQNRRKKSKNAKTKDNTFDGLEMSSTQMRPVLDGPMLEVASTNGKTSSYQEESTLAYSKVQSSGVDGVSLRTNKAEVEINPNQYINVKPKELQTLLPDRLSENPDALDDAESDEEKYDIITEAFADDDVVEEFRKEKQENIKKSQVETTNFILPGWGSWGGKHSKKVRPRRRRFVTKLPKDAPRKDENKGDVIIFDGNNTKIKEHQVNELPYPFTSVKDFEASMRMPIGRDFIPENAHRKLTKPRIKTKMGEVIEPMSEAVLVETQTNRIPVKRRASKQLKSKK